MAPPPSPSSPPIPQSFQTRKSSIMTSLTLPTHSYSDASPKGSLDTAIVPLVNRINGLPGVVTTSSCSGRISVFVEGRKPLPSAIRTRAVDDETEGEKKGINKSVPGGKGMGGRWTFVSHEAVDKPPYDGERKNEGVLGRMLGLGSSEGVDRHCTKLSGTRSRRRYVKFAFEPMILHILAASLHHARPLLSAAIASGFRESGIQSLKNLDDLHAFPMLAVRSAGLGFESIIGFVIESSEKTDKAYREDAIESLVSEEYLELLLELANERLEANWERMLRFEEALFGDGKVKKEKWEDEKERRERKRFEGLRRKEDAWRENGETENTETDDDEDLNIELLGMT
ncbi:MAG: hypothetical protein LQ351_002063 [Letrouitia transgressa]|nr:MAG: hypothetical protein LQ351_002063 [Letrouitia transgressa]